MKKIFRRIAGLGLGLALVSSVAAFLGSKFEAKSVKADDTPVMTFDFEDNDAHRTSGSNSYTGTNNYSENGSNIVLTYADSVTSGTPLNGSANVMARVAKNTTNSPSVVIGPIDLSSYYISGFSYLVKGVGTLTITSSYSLDGTNYTQAESYSAPSSKTTKGISTLALDEEDSVYLKFVVTITNSTSINSNRDTQFDDIKLIGHSTGTKPLDSISCSDQELNVTQSVDLSNCVVFVPTDAANKNVSYTLKSGSDYADLDGAVVTAKKGGSAVVTITPEDTSGGATAIDVNVSITSLSVPQITVGEPYVIYAIDETNGNYEMSGLASSLGSATTFTGDIPSCDYVLETEDGYYENTVAFKNGTKYLALTSAANNIHQETSVTANSSWIVEYDSSTNAAVVTNAVYQNRSIQFNYNTGNPRFACYSLGGQTAIRLYHYVESALTDFQIEAELSVYKTASKAITVTYTPADASDKELNWTSDDETIATVSDKGVVTGVAVGQTTIHASKTINSVLVTRDCDVTVLSNSSVHRGTVADPFDVADAVQVAKGVFVKDPDGVDIDLTQEYYVSGQITKTVTETRSNLSFWIGDDLSQISAATGAFEVFKAAKVFGEALADRYATDNEVKADFEVGDYVTVKGILTFYNGTTAETSQNTADIVYSSRAVSYSTAVVAFAESFLDLECDATGANMPDTYEWLAYKGDFESDALTNTDREALRTAKAVKIVSPSTDVEKVQAAMAKYDYIIVKYNKGQGLTTEFPDFINRDPSAERVISNPIVNTENNNTTAIILVTIIAVASISSIAVLLVIKKRKTY